jgi:hypothetical protein
VTHLLPPRVQQQRQRHLLASRVALALISLLICRPRAPLPSVLPCSSRSSVGGSSSSSSSSSEHADIYY